MRKSVLFAAVLAIAAPSLAFAGEAQQAKKAHLPAVKATQMSDAEMDKVTAGQGGGAGIIYVPGQMLGVPNSPFGGAYGGIVYPGGSGTCVNGCFY